MPQDYTLRQWRLGDEESLVRNANNYKIWKNLKDIFPNPYTIEDAGAWVRMATDSEETFAIVIDNEAVGGIGILLKEDIYQKNAEIGYWLGEDYWGKGIISSAIPKIVDYTFKKYDIHRIYAGVFEYNLASMRALEKAGFEKEAILKESLFKEGHFYDEHIYVKFK
ncbi:MULTISPECIES: GNAT family N-acetyltransferase [Emticicia]|uniref:GNAT family N-acetyltransferase n=1 Tax=Emticicia TaxID=312278 RepID=UPI0007D8B2D2|nr:MULTISPECIES: GNAT family protein [Emticicia]